jgi:hypothetical protein
MLTTILNAKATFFGRSFSLSHISGNLQKASPILGLLGIALLIDVVNSQLVASKSPECEAYYQERLQVHGSGTAALIFEMLQAGCMSFMNKVTEQPLSVADENGICADPKNCIRLGLGGLDIAMSTEGSYARRAEL